MTTGQRSTQSVGGGDGAADAVADAVGAVRDGLGALRAIDWWRLSGAELVEAAREVEVTLRSGYGVQVRLAGQIARRGVGADAGVRSPAHLLHQALALTVGEARGRIAAAEAALESESPSGAAVAARDPQILAAVDRGAASAGQVRVITGCLEKIPSRVDARTRGLCRDTLIGQAAVRDENGLRRVVEKILSVVDPDGSLSDSPVAERAELTIGVRRPDGLTPLRGLLSPLAAEQARVAIEALAKPCPIDADTPDPRPAALRREQALGEILHRHLTAGAGPRTGGVRPQVTVTIPADDLFARTGRTPGASPGDAPGASLAGGAPGTPGGVSLAGGAWSDYDGPQTIRMARLLACDGDIIPQVLGGDSVVLDQGRARRLFTPEQRRALITRDKGCAFPGCDIPPGWCEAHHIIWWTRGGATDIDNGVLLCRRHHTLIHQGDWRITTDPHGGRPWFVPPEHIDPARKPRRNIHHHLPQHLKPLNPSETPEHLEPPSPPLRQ